MTRNELRELALIGAAAGLLVFAVLRWLPAVQHTGALLLAAGILACLKLGMVWYRARRTPPVPPPVARPRDPYARETDLNWTGLVDHPAPPNDTTDPRA